MFQRAVPVLIVGFRQINWSLSYSFDMIGKSPQLSAYRAWSMALPTEWRLLNLYYGLSIVLVHRVRSIEAYAGSIRVE